MGIFSKRKYVEAEKWPEVIATISRAFEALREEYIFGSLSQLKKEGADVSQISRDIAPESELEDLLKGFQLTCMMGIAYDYLKEPKEQIAFEESLSSRLGAKEGSRPWQYREKYLDCKGNIPTLCESLSSDIHRAIGFPEPRKEFLIQFQGGAQILIILCQVETCNAFGDGKRASSLRQEIHG